MIVMHNNRKYECEIPQSLFVNLKTVKPNFELELLAVNASTYKKLIRAKVSELEIVKDEKVLS